MVLAGLLIAGAGMLLLLILFSGTDDSGPDPDAPRPTTAPPEFIECPSDAPPYGDAHTGEVLDPAGDPPYGYGDPYGDPYPSAYAGSAQTDYAVTQPSPAPYTASGSSNPIRRRRGARAGRETRWRRRPTGPWRPRSSRERARPSAPADPHGPTSREG